MSSSDIDRRAQVEGDWHLLSCAFCQSAGADVCFRVIECGKCSCALPCHSQPRSRVARATECCRSNTRRPSTDMRVIVSRGTLEVLGAEPVSDAQLSRSTLLAQLSALEGPAEVAVRPDAFITWQGIADERVDVNSIDPGTACDLYKVLEPTPRHRPQTCFQHLSCRRAVRTYALCARVLLADRTSKICLL
jgi:hypothetical protein